MEVILTTGAPERQLTVALRRGRPVSPIPGTHMVQREAQKDSQTVFTGLHIK